MCVKTVSVKHGNRAEKPREKADEQENLTNSRSQCKNTLRPRLISNQIVCIVKANLRFKRFVFYTSPRVDVRDTLESETGKKRGERETN